MVTQAEASFVLHGIKWGGEALGTSSGQVIWNIATVNFAEQPFSFKSFITREFLSPTGQAFDAWKAVANIDFVEVNNAASVDIRLGFISIYGVSDTLAKAFFRFVSASSTIDFDTAESYVVDEGNVGNGNVNFKTVAVPEIGHAIAAAQNIYGSAAVEAQNGTAGGSSFHKYRFTSDSGDDVVTDQFAPCFSTNSKFRQTSTEPA